MADGVRNDRSSNAERDVAYPRDPIPKRRNHPYPYKSPQLLAHLTCSKMVPLSLLQRLHPRHLGRHELPRRRRRRETLPCQCRQRPLILPHGRLVLFFQRARTLHRHQWDSCLWDDWICAVRRGTLYY